MNKFVNLYFTLFKKIKNFYSIILSFINFNKFSPHKSQTYLNPKNSNSFLDHFKFTISNLPKTPPSDMFFLCPLYFISCRIVLKL